MSLSLSLSTIAMDYLYIYAKLFRYWEMYISVINCCCSDIVNVKERAELTTSWIYVRVIVVKVILCNSPRDDFLTAGYHSGPFGTVDQIEYEAGHWDECRTPQTTAECFSKLTIRNCAWSYSVEHSGYFIFFYGEQEHAGYVWYVDPW